MSAERFRSLFTGNDRSFGVFNPKTNKLFTKNQPVDLSNYEDHLEGSKGVGIVPIMDDETCWFGAIDIDAHGNAPDIDLLELEQKIRDNDFPLTICRSRSGGAHLYLFLTDPAPAKTLRKVLANWAGIIGYAGVEIFPKQDSLPESGGERQLGNWINMPYFDAEDTNRFAFEGGKQIDLNHFLDIAESRRIKPAILVEKAEGGYAEAPPCIQKMITDGVGHGHRNEALYNLVLYYKKANPETLRDKSFDANATIFEEPLSYAEAKKTIQSAGRREYRYKCKEEPCWSNCNSSVCVTRKFGITPEERGELEIGKPPEFDKLEKYTTDPVKWVLYVDNTPITLSTAELMDYRAVRRAIADNLTRIIAPMKNDKWEVMLHKIMSEAIVVEAPEEASTYGFIKDRLYEFFSRTDLSSDGESIEEREALFLGSPVVQKVDGQRVVYFRGPDFIDFLKKNRSEELKGSNLWMALRRVGVQHSKLRVKNQVVSVWFAPLNESDYIELTPARVEPEI